MVVTVTERKITAELVELSLTHPQLTLKVLNYGATVTAIYTPDHQGKQKNIVLGYTDVKEYAKKRSFIGCAVGPVAGRIADGRWRRGDEWIQLEQNEGAHHLHGGQNGFDTHYWEYDFWEEEGQSGVAFYATFPKERGGYPSKLEMTITYLVDAAGMLTIKYEGKAEEEMLVNPTNHSYFNLSGEPTQPIDDHLLFIASNQYVPLVEEHLLAATPCLVTETDFDCREGRPLHQMFSSNDEQMKQEKGLNHPFLLNKAKPWDIRLYHPATSRGIEMITTSNGVICYTGNHFVEHYHCGIALETQEPNMKTDEGRMPSLTVGPGQPFCQTTTYRFFSKKCSSDT